jgi:uncharacterized protein (DUF1499 family)
MGLVRWFTRNWANTTEPTHPDMTPMTLLASVPEAVAAIERAVAGKPRWRVIASDPTAGTMHLTRRTTVFRFVDDVRLTFVPDPGGCRVHAESRSRVGVGDLGQNRRNILELWAALKGLRA